jgi:hypothetical protein
MLNHLIAQPEVPVLEPVRPHIRSSDAKFGDDYLYLLRRRYGLVKAGTYSEPLALGSHYHKLFEVEGTDTWLRDWAEYRDAVLQERPGSKFVERDLDFAFHTWTGVLKGLPVSDDGQRLGDYLDLTKAQTIASELKVSVGRASASNQVVPCTIQIDRLGYNANDNSLTIYDLKSTSLQTQVRAAACPFEFQTWHYIVTLQTAVTSGALETWGVPSDARVTGMDHIIFQKPTIRMSQEDRDYTLKKVTPTRGKNAGTTRLERDYHGEPQWSNFVDRCITCYKDQAMPALVSQTHLTGNQALMAEYYVRLDRLLERATRDPRPELHPRSESGAVDWRSVSDYYPFYLDADPGRWPVLAVRHQFSVEHRDEPLNLKAGEVYVHPAAGDPDER